RTRDATGRSTVRDQSRTSHKPRRATGRRRRQHRESQTTAAPRHEAPPAQGRPRCGFDERPPPVASWHAMAMSDEEQQRRRQAVRDVMPKTPFIGGLGLVFERYDPDDVTMRLPFREDLTNDGTYYH